jgi:hypothetical protein
MLVIRGWADDVTKCMASRSLEELLACFDVSHAHVSIQAYEASNVPTTMPDVQPTDGVYHPILGVS